MWGIFEWQRLGFALFVQHSIQVNADFSLLQIMTTLLLVLILISLNAIYAQQYYDSSSCSAETSYPGSRYTCKSYQKSCNTFLVYRANQHFNTILNVSALFQVDVQDLLHWNKNTSPTEELKAGREVLVRVNCSCIGQFFQASFSYIAAGNTSLPEIACAVFEGLVKSRTLVDANGHPQNYVKVGTKLNLPLRCACPDNSSSNVGIKYLVTYPVVEGDGPTRVSEKFGVSPPDLWQVNHFEPWPTIYPITTILVPLKTDFPDINFDISISPPPVPGFLPTITIEHATNTKLRNLYIAGPVVAVSLLLAALVACGLYVRALHKAKLEKLQSFNTGSSPLSCSTARSSPRSGLTALSSTQSCLSPDLLAGIKFSLKHYSIEDMRRATKDFSEESKIGDQAYKGLLDNGEFMIKQMRFEDTRQVIDIHSKINHINIVSLVGVCYGENDFSWSYLVFEMPNSGCLRDCLSNSSSPLRWHRRTQIAFDIATGLHYLHYCIFPSYAHMSVDSRNIFVTSNGRAKLTNIRTDLGVGSSKGNDNIEKCARGWVAPEYIVSGSASDKVDIFAFGVVLLELLSGKEDVDGKLFKESIGFLGGAGSEGGCFEQLRSFMDPSLKQDCPLAEALCLAVLAKACVEDDPLHRPSMDDILKVLGRMV